MGDAIGKEGCCLRIEGVLLALPACSAVRSPDLYSCHGCGLNLPINGSVNGLTTLDSQWRVVFLCRVCFTGVRLAQVCSYCFSWFPELEKELLDCNLCSRRVHRACVPLHHRNLSHSLLDAVNFICVDCCPIPQISREDPIKSGGSISRAAFRVPLEDLVRETLISEKKAISEVKENLEKKVMVLSGSSELKTKTPGNDHQVNEPSCINSAVSDEDFHLHQTINGSRRSSRTLCPNGVDLFNAPNNEQLRNNSFARIAESSCCGHFCKIKVNIENKSLLKDRGKPESVLTDSLFFEQENGDLMKQVDVCSANYPGDFSMNEIEGCNIDSCGHQDNIEASIGNTSLMENIGNPEPVLTDTLLFEQENGDLMKQVKGCNTCFSENFSLNEMEGCNPNSYANHDKIEVSIENKFFSKDRGKPESILTNSSLFEQENADLMKQVEGCNTSYEMEECNTNSCAHHDEIEFIIENKSFPEDRGKPESALANNSSLVEQENDDLLKHEGCNTSFSGEFSLKEMEGCDTNSCAHHDKIEIFIENKSLPEDKGQPKSNLTNSSLFEQENGDLMKQVEGCNTSYLGEFSSNEIEGCNANSCTHHDKIEVSIGNKLLLEDRGDSESALTNSSLFKRENGDLIKQVEGRSTNFPEDFSLNEGEGCLKFQDSTADGSNSGFASLSCHSISTLLKTPMPNSKYRFNDVYGEEFPKLKRKNVDAMDPDGSMKKYFRKNQSSECIMRENSHSISCNCPSFKWENGDIMKQNMACCTVCFRDFPFKEKDSFMKFSNSNGVDTTANSTLSPSHSLKAQLNSAVPVTKYGFCVCNGAGCSKLKRKCIDAIGPGRPLKKYFRKCWRSEKNMQGNSELILNSSPLLKQSNRDLVKQITRFNTGCPGDSSLKEESSPKYPGSTDDVSNFGSTLLTCDSLNTQLNNSMTLSKNRFGDGDGEGSSKLQRKSIDPISFRSMQKYFRKQGSSKKFIKGNCESILVDSSFSKNEIEDLMKQIRECNTGYPGGFSLKKKKTSLTFPDSTKDNGNVGVALLSCHSLKTFPISTNSHTNHIIGGGDEERPCKLQRKSVDAMVSEGMKKYYRKHWSSKRIMRENSHPVLANKRLFKQENGDPRKQVRGWNKGCTGDFPLKEEISVKFPDSINDRSSIDSSSLQLHSVNACLNSTIPLVKLRHGAGDGERCPKLQRRSIDEIGFDGSLKAYFRKKL